MLFYFKLLPKAKLCTEFEFASFSGCKNNQGSQIFLDAPLAKTLDSFGPKRCFLISYFPNPSFIPNLKLLASTVAEISRGSQIFLDAFLAQTLANFGRKCCFILSYSPNPSCIPNLKLLASTVAEINMWSQIFICLPSQVPPLIFALKVVFDRYSHTQVV